MGGWRTLCCVKFQADQPGACTQLGLGSIDGFDLRSLGLAIVGSVLLLIGLRALRRGERITLLGTEADLWVYAYKVGTKEIAVVALNRGGATHRTIPAGALNLAGSGITRWISALGVGTAATSGNDLTLDVGEGEGAIFVAK